MSDRPGDEVYQCKHCDAHAEDELVVYYDNLVRACGNCGALL